jgi:hypothetical protein
MFKARSDARLKACAIVMVGLLVLTGSVRLVGPDARAAEAERADAPLPEVTARALAEEFVESSTASGLGRRSRSSRRGSGAP